MIKLYRKNVETLHNKNPNNFFLIDSQTRKDLALDDFYQEYNNTKTSYGDQMFYYRINSQSNNLQEVHKTISDLKYLSNNKKESILLGHALNKIGKQKRGNIVNDLWDGLIYKPRFLDLIPIWVVLGPTIIVFLLLTIGESTLWGVLGLIIINLIIFRTTNQQVSAVSGSMNYLIKSLSVLNKFKKKDNYFNRYLNYNNKLNRMKKYKIYLQDGVGLSIIGNDLASSILDYLRIFLCAELFAYYKIYKYINSYKNDIKSVIQNIGYLDFIINNSEIIEENLTCFPRFSNVNIILFKDLTHPLIENCTPYNFEISNHMIITGMNMAGKSTFMKSVAINQILAMSFGFTFAKEYCSNSYYVISSMKVEDDIKNNKSKYYMEAERLLLVQNLLKENKLLCIIDEILTGTNTVDRVEASIGILRNYIKYKGSFIIAATHDKDIAEKLYPVYSNYYFDGDIKEKEIIYNYNIKEGIVRSRNALRLLVELGLEV